MSSEYRNICDLCGKETRGFCTNKTTDKELAQDNWNIQIYNHWWEDVNDSDLKERKEEREVSLDACRDCSKECAEALRKLKDEIAKR